MSGYVYPNEIEVAWSLLIVLYPFITGLVAGAFIVSALYHVFKINRLKPVAKFSLVTSLAFLMVAPIPLLLHLGQPLRGPEIFWTPQPRSAMAGFGYIWMLYLLLVLVETWLVFRKDIVKWAQSSKGLKKLAYSILTLGVYDVSERAVHADEKIVKTLAMAGIPMAILLHGYVGFIFGAIKANPWWSTPLMPIIFLLSAIVSGTALLIILYVLVSKLRRKPVDMLCLSSMVNWLGGFLTVALFLEALEVISMVYEGQESWGILSLLITQKLRFSYLEVQLLLGSALPFVLLAALAIAGHRIKPSPRIVLTVLTAFLVLIGVFAMRWNVVIGGQLFSKSLDGFKSYVPELVGLEGVTTAAAIMALPFVILAVLCYFLPPWHDEAPAREKVTSKLSWGSFSR